MHTLQRRVWGLVCRVLVAIGLAGTGPAAVASTTVAGDPGSGPPAVLHAADYDGMDRRSRYLTMRDGTRIAVDVYLPNGLAADRRVPAVLYQTRYWRRMGIRFPFSLFVDGADLQGILSQIRRTVVERGYAWVDVDARGSGASFGIRPWDYAPDEILDGGEIADWIVEQPWSNGRIATAGASYSGSTAEFALVNRHPAIQAVVNLSSEFDQYTDILFPGGVPLAFYLDGWGALTQALDRNQVPDPDWKARLAVTGVAPVDGSGASRARREAVAGHAANYDFREIKRFVYRDDFLLRDDADLPAARQEANRRSFEWLEGKFGPGFRARGLDLASQHAYQDDLRASGAVTFGIAGWFDGPYANAMIKRFKTLPGTRLLIGPWDHHQINVSPFGSAPSLDLTAELVTFLDGTVGDRPEGLTALPPVRYYTMGAERWRTAEDWPPPSVRRRLYLAEGGQLSANAPTAPDARDRYAVDREATTGRHTRWDTLIGRALHTPYPDRAAQAARLQVYETAVLERALEVTGHPRVRLHVTSTATDGAFFAYLEDVWPDGRVVYVTEGQLRALHRQLQPTDSTRWEPAPAPSYRRADAVPLQPGVPAVLEFDLLPTSYEFRAGHRLRLSLAGADRDHFGAIPGPELPAPTVEFLRSRDAASWLEIPDASAGGELRVPSTGSVVMRASDARGGPSSTR